MTKGRLIRCTVLGSTPNRLAMPHRAVQEFARASRHRPPSLLFIAAQAGASSLKSSMPEHRL
jgi:hypothetical protein